MTECLHFILFINVSTFYHERFVEVYKYNHLRFKAYDVLTAKSINITCFTFNYTKKMACCPICGRSLVRLANHLRKVHNLFYNTTQPTTLKEFIHLLKHFPISPEEWEYITKHKKQLDRFCKSNEILPTKLFQVIYKNFDLYRSGRAPKLVLLNGLFPANKLEVSKDNQKGAQELEFEGKPPDVKRSKLGEYSLQIQDMRQPHPIANDVSIEQEEGPHLETDDTQGMIGHSQLGQCQSKKKRGTSKSLKRAGTRPAQHQR